MPSRKLGPPVIGRRGVRGTVLGDLAVLALGLA
jgi:hypothetical protein